MKLIGSIIFITSLMNSAYALDCNYFFEQRLFPIFASNQYKIIKSPQYNPENVKWLKRESFYTNEIVMQKEGNAFAIDQFVKRSKKRGTTRFISVTSRDSERLFGSDYEVFHQIRLPDDEIIAYSTRIDEETAMVVTVRDFNKSSAQFKEVNFYVINKDGFDNYVAKMKYEDDFDKLKVGVAVDGSFIAQGSSGVNYQLQLKSAAAKTAQE